MKQDNCPHTNLTVLGEPVRKMRCRHCDLTIDADELADSYCPECYEATGDKKFDFEAVAAEQKDTRYRCEDCGMMIEYSQPK